MQEILRLYGLYRTLQRGPTMCDTDTLIAHISEGVEDYLKKTARELTRRVRERSTHLSQICSIKVTYANFLEMAKVAKPICEVLEAGEPDSEGKRRFKFRITSPDEASLLGIIIGGDTNAELHMGPGGTTQSNALIGICTYAVMRSLGGILKIIDPMNFASALQLGEPVLITITIGPGRAKVLGDIIMIHEQSGQIIMDKAKLTMFVPRPK